MRGSVACRDVDRERGGDADRSHKGEHEQDDCLAPVADAGGSDGGCGRDRERDVLRVEGSEEEPDGERLPTLNDSIVPIHFGVGGSASPCGRDRHWRSATSSTGMPSATSSRLTQVAGLPLLEAPAGCAIRRTIAPSAISPSSQPTTYAVPVAAARGVSSNKTEAMIGTGLIAAPTASARIWPIACPIAQPAGGFGTWSSGAPIGIG